MEPIKNVCTVPVLSRQILSARESFSPADDAEGKWGDRGLGGGEGERTLLAGSNIASEPVRAEQRR